MPHLSFALTGGLALRHYLTEHGKPVPSCAFNDIDLVAESTDVVYASESTTTVLIDGTRVRLVSKVELLIRLMSLILGICENKVVEPKNVTDAQQLMDIADVAQAERLWRKSYPQYDCSLVVTFQKVMEKMRDHPRLVKKAQYTSSLFAQCSRCVLSHKFFLAPKKQMRSIVGYV